MLKLEAPAKIQIPKINRAEMQEELASNHRQETTNVEAVPEYNRQGFFMEFRGNHKQQQLELALEILKASPTSKVTLFSSGGNIQLNPSLEQYRREGRLILSEDSSPKFWCQDLGEPVLINNKPHLLIFDDPIGNQEKLGDDFTLTYVGRNLTPPRNNTTFKFVNDDGEYNSVLPGGDITIAVNKYGRPFIMMGDEYWNQQDLPPPKGLINDSRLSSFFGIKDIYVFRPPSLHIDQFVTFPKDGVAILPTMVDPILDEIKPRNGISAKAQIQRLNNYINDYEKELQQLGFDTIRIKVPFDYYNGWVDSEIPERFNSQMRSYLNMIPVSNGEKTTLIMPSWDGVLDSEKTANDRIKEIEQQNRHVLTSRGFNVVYVKDRRTNNGDHHCIVGTYPLPK